jgi:4-amino-4-deoxy-L-arabinose transferase-like glycosyltransferase
VRAPAAAAALAVLVAAPLVLVGLGRAPFDDPGEGMHAEIARELLGSREPFALTLSGVRYVDKPPLLHALCAAVFALAGPSEWAARLPPALAGLLAVAATAWLGAKLLGVGGGFLAGAALATSVGFYAYARYVRPETLLVAALAGGFALVLVGLAERRSALVVAGLAAFGAAGLAKDPLAALLPPLAVGLGLVPGRRARPVRRWLPISGAVACVALALGWWLLAELRTPGFTWYTVVDNHLLNVVRARHYPDEDVPLGAAEFLLVAGLGAAPWIVAAGAGVGALLRRRAWRDPAEGPWVVLALWAAAVLAFTAASPFRLPHYGLPAYPMIALLAARAWQTGGGRGLPALHVALFAAMAVACGLGWASDGTLFRSSVLGAADVATRKSAAAGQAAPVPPWEDFRPLLGTAAVVFAAGAATVGVALVARPAIRGRRLAALAVVATMLGSMPVVAAALERVASHRAVRGLALEVGRRARPTDTLVHEGPLESSGALEWYSGRRPVIVDGRRSVLGFGATLPGAAEAFWDRERLERAWGAEGRVWLVTVRAPEASVVRHLPGARPVLAAGGRRLYVNRDD